MSDKTRQGWRMIASGGFFCLMGSLVALFDLSTVALIGLIFGTFGGYAAGFAMSALVQDKADVKLDEEIRRLRYWPDESELE